MATRLDVHGADRRDDDRPTIAFPGKYLEPVGNSFLHLKKTIYLKSVQPFGALLFAIYAGVWIFSRRWWKQRTL